MKKALRESLNASFDKRVVFLDEDFQKKNPQNFEAAIQLAKKENISLIFSQPCCLECLLLEILGHKQKAVEDCQFCKSKLKKLLNRQDESCLTIQEFERFFSREVIDIKREQVGILRGLIQLMEE